VRLHCRVDLLLDRREVERSGCLHRRKLDRGSRQIRDLFLYLHEAPELARQEVVQVSAARIVQRLAVDRRRPLEALVIGADVKPSDVITHDEQDVRLLTRRLLRLRGLN